MYDDPYNALRTMDVVPQSHICRIKHMLHCRFLSMTQQSQKNMNIAKSQKKTVYGLISFILLLLLLLQVGSQKRSCG